MRFKEKANAMHGPTRRLEFCYERGGWTVSGLPRESSRRFDDLAEALDHAKAECMAEPATIELLVGGFHAIAFQQRGWTRPLCCPTPRRAAASRAAAGERARPAADRPRRSPVGRLAG